MPRFFFLLVASAFIFPAFSRAQSTEPEIATAARVILDAYHADAPQPGKRKLHIICWRTADRDFAENHRERITRMMTHIQGFYAKEMERIGFGHRSINLDIDSDGELVIHEATGSGNYDDYSKPEGQRVKNDCWPVLKKAGINPDRETVLIFTNLSKWDPVANTFVHKSPYYANGNHQRGTAWQLDSPELDTKNLALKTPLIQDGEYGRISLGKHNSIFIGGIAHELGHGLGLPHCRERKDEKEAHGTALMGSGNRSYFDEVRGEGKGSFITLAHALRLASHPQFSGSIKGMNIPAKAEFSEMSVTPSADHSSFTVLGKVSCPIPVYAIIAYLDPAGGGDYDAKTHSTVPDADGKFTIPCTALWPRKNGDLRIVALIANGATSQWSGSYQSTKDGKVDVSSMHLSLELSEFLSALEARDFTGAEKLRDQLGNTRAGEIATTILNGKHSNRPTVTAGKINRSSKRYPLSQITPDEATVGWGKPVYDHLPRPAALLISGGEIFETGIYAHANALHAYDLTNAGWRMLVGKCGLPNQRGGSVVFVIKADGKEVFRSQKTEPGTLREYNIDLTGVKKLELITEDAGDGIAVDWGIWLDPTLKR